jgi:hypothetical protein
VPARRTPSSPLADRSDLAQVYARDDLATNQKNVRDGDRVTSLSIACGEVALEIHAPQLIRASDQRDGSEHGVVRFLFLCGLV